MCVSCKNAANHDSVTTATDPHSALEHESRVDGRDLIDDARMVKLVAAKANTHWKVWICLVNTRLYVAVRLRMRRVLHDDG